MLVVELVQVVVLDLQTEAEELVEVAQRKLLALQTLEAEQVALTETTADLVS